MRCTKGSTGKLDYVSDANCIGLNQEGVTTDGIGATCDVGGECVSVNRRCSPNTKRTIADTTCTAENTRLCSSVTKGACVAANKRCSLDATNNYNVATDTACFAADDDRSTTGTCNAPQQCIAKGVRCDYYSQRSADTKCLGVGQEQTAAGVGNRYEGGILCEPTQIGRCETGKYCDGSLWKPDTKNCPNNQSSLPSSTSSECPEAKRNVCVGDKKCKDDSGTLKLLPDTGCAARCGSLPSLQCSTEAVCVGNKYCSGGCLVEGTQWGCGINKPQCQEGVCNNNYEICRNGEYVPTEFGCDGSCSPIDSCHKKYNYRCQGDIWAQDSTCVNGVDTKKDTSANTASSTSSSGTGTSQNASVCAEDACDSGTATDPGPRVCSGNKWIPATLSNSKCSDQEAGYCTSGRCHPSQGFRCGETGFYWDTDAACQSGRDTTAGGTECTGVKCTKPGYICANGFEDVETECYAAGKNVGESDNDDGTMTNSSSTVSTCDPICTAPGMLKNAQCQLVAESKCCLEGHGIDEGCD